jgi:hypothetical protein
MQQMGHSDPGRALQVYAKVVLERNEESLGRRDALILALRSRSKSLPTDPSDKTTNDESGPFGGRFRVWLYQFALPSALQRADLRSALAAKKALLPGPSI